MFRKTEGYDLHLTQRQAEKFSKLLEILQNDPDFSPLWESALERDLEINSFSVEVRGSDDHVSEPGVGDIQITS